MDEVAAVVSGDGDPDGIESDTCLVTQPAPRGLCGDGLSPFYHASKDIFATVESGDSSNEPFCTESPLEETARIADCTETERDTAIDAREESICLRMRPGRPKRSIRHNNTSSDLGFHLRLLSQCRRGNIGRSQGRRARSWL